MPILNRDITSTPKNVCDSCWYINYDTFCHRCGIITPKGIVFLDLYGLTGEETCDCGYETAKNGCLCCNNCGKQTPWGKRENN